MITMLVLMMDVLLPSDAHTLMLIVMIIVNVLMTGAALYLVVIGQLTIATMTMLVLLTLAMLSLDANTNLFLMMIQMLVQMMIVKKLVVLFIPL
jgi:hypothetical protein